MADDNGVVMAMDFEERERRRSFVEQSRAMLADLDIELRELAVSRVDRDLDASAAPTASPVRTRAEIEADRLAGWKQWIRNLQAEERQYILDIVAAALSKNNRAAAEATDDAIAVVREAIGEAMAEYVGKKTAELRDEIQQLRAELSELRTELTNAKAHERGQVVAA
jgi:hypothetical protein